MRAAFLLLVLMGCSSAPTRLVYPSTRRGAEVETHRGVAVADPYRWLEAMDSAETKAWVAAQNQLVDRYLAQQPGRAALHARLEQLFSVESTWAPQHRGGRYFWAHKDGKRDQPTIEMATSIEGAATTVLDANTFGGDAVYAGMTPSDDGTKIAYGMATASGDWQRWRIRDLATGKDLADELADIKYYAPSWAHDGSGLYYARFPSPAPGTELTASDRDHKVYFHRLGTPRSDDHVVYERPDQPTWQLQPEVSRDGKYLVITIGDGQVGDSSVEQVGYLELDKPGAKVTPLVATYEAEYVFLGNRGSTLYFQTTASAPHKKVVAVDVASPAKWRDVVPQGKAAILAAAIAGDQLLVSEMRDAHSAIVAYDLRGTKLREVALPGLGSAYVGPADANETETSIWFSSFTTPGQVLRLELATGATRAWHPPAVAFDARAFETTQVFFTSKDGTKVPMFVVAKRGLAQDGTHPTLMTGYGWGGISSTPYYAANLIPWLERGGVFVLVNMRGGGEYGEEWHLAARRAKQQTKYDDFIAAAEWLIAHKWTSPAHLAAYGYSGGGTLVATVLVQRPDLFGAIAPIAGVDDLLRFPLFGQGAGWQADMGFPDDASDFPVLRKLSPVHNARPAQYPAVFVITSDHDVRVAPLHSYKLAAALQAAQTGPSPVLLRVQTESGHGGGWLRSQEIEQNTELFVFLAASVGLPL